MAKLRRLWVSVSGGRTSAYMAYKLKELYSHKYDLKFIYANTGLEHEETLLFLNRIDKQFGLNLIWVEAVINKQWGKGTTHKVVNFESACRNGRLFEQMIDVYGIPNQAYPHCNRELKINAMKSYVKSIGWDKEFRAIGIRIDEAGRCSEKASIERKMYPLVDFFETDKEDVLRWFSNKDYDLNIPDYLGNCVTCWKKTDTKILRIINDEPSRFDFFKRMEAEKGLSGHNVDGTKRKFFRKHRGVVDMFNLKDVLQELDFDSVDRCSSEECGLE